MAVLLSGTTIGGNAAIHAGNISTYALTSIPATISPTNIYVGNAIYFGGANNYFNWDGARINSNVGIQSASDMRAPIFYDSNDTNYYLDPNSTSVLNRVYTTGRLEVTYNTDRYQMNFLRGSGSNWWVTNDSDKLGLHLNNVGDRIYFATDGNIWSAYYNDWLSNIFNSKQNASTAITTSNIGSQSVNYASSAGNADTVDGRHADYFYPNNTDNGYSTGDINGNTTHQRLWGTDSVQNLLAFRPPTSIEYSTDGTNWTATTATNGLWDNKMFGKWGGFTMAVGNNIGAWRFVRMTWVNFGYHFFSHFTLAHSTNGHSFNFVFQKSDLNGVFSGEAFRQNGINSWPGYTFTKHSNVSGWWDTRDIRFVFELNHNNDFPNNGISIGHIGLMGGYSGFTRLYDWDGDRKVYFSNEIHTTKLVDANNNTYYFDGDSLTSLRTRGSWRADSSDWDGEYSGKIQYHSGHWYFQAGDRWYFRNAGGSNVFEVTQAGNVYPNGEVVAPTLKARKAQSDNNYTTAALWTESYSTTTTGLAFHISGVVGKFLEMRTNGILYWDNNTVIHTGNIASQSVSYADESGFASSAGSVEWTSVQNKPATFPPSSHNHDDRYYTESESDGKYLIGTTNPGNVANFTISIGNNGSYSYVQSHAGQPLYLNPVGNSIVLNSTTTVAGTAQFNSNTTWFSGRATIGLENQSEFARFAFYGLSLWDWDHGEQMVVDGNYVYVNNYLQAGNSLLAPIFYDSNDTTYYGDFASTSYLRHLSVGDVNASNDGSWNARLNLTGSSHARLDVKSNSDGIITTMYSHTGHGVGRVGTMSNHPLAFMVNGSIASGLIWDSTNGSRFVVGESISTPYTLIDSNKRPVIYARGAYPVLTLDHTETGNPVHGPTIQFVHNGLEGRQFVIGTNGTGTQLDFGYSDTPSYGNTNYNPHHGIGGYNGKTIMRLTTTGLLVGDAGTYPTIRTAERDLDVRGSQNISGFLNVNGATEHTVNDNGSVIHGTTTNNRVFINGSIQLTSNNDAIVIGRGTATFLSDEELGFGWGGGWYMTESSYIRSRGSKSLHMNGGSVDYVGSLYLEGSVGVHLQPNAGSYGSLQVTGSKDGWHGVRFTGSNVVVMANTNQVGFHNNNAGWQFLWSEGTAYVYKGGTGGGTQATVWDSVNAPRANLSDLMHYEGFTLDANSMRSNSTGFTYSNNAPETGPIARFSTGGGYDLWINAGYWSGSDLWFRTRNGDTASINAWRRNLNATSDFYAANMNQYVRTSDSVTFGGVTAPTILVNNQSDNTKGYRIYNTSNSSVSAMFVNSANALVIGAGAFDQVQLNKKTFINGAALGVNVAASATAGRIDASNDIVAYSSSDERLKHNIAPIENALDKVKSLTGVEFDWKPEYKDAHGYEGHDTGIIAQQVEAVMPSAVRTNDTGFLAVRYEKLIGLLIEGMKEQQAQIDELKAKLDGLTK